MPHEVYCSTERVTTQGRYQFAIDESRLFTSESPSGDTQVVLIIEDAGVIAKISARDFVALSDVAVSPVTNKLIFQFKCYPESTTTQIRSARQKARQELFAKSIVWKRWFKN